jgi:hypothetical protein
VWFVDNSYGHSHVEASDIPAVGSLFDHHRITIQCCSIVVTGNVKTSNQ